MNAPHGKHERLNAVLAAAIPPNLSLRPAYSPAALKLPTGRLCWAIEAYEQLGAIKVEPALDKGCFVHPRLLKAGDDLARNESANNLYGFTT